jgi:hypothetical protein
MMRKKGREGEREKLRSWCAKSACVCVCVCERERDALLWLKQIVAIGENFFCIKLCTLVVIYTISLTITSKLSVAKRSILQQRVSKFMLNQFHENDLLMKLNKYI